MKDALVSYARRLRELRRANPTIIEPALAPTFQRLIEEIIQRLPQALGLTVQPEFNNPGAGRPDIALVRAGEPPRAFIELKAPSKAANPESWREPHDRRQFERLKELGHWATSNFVDFYLFHRDMLDGHAAIVPEHTLDPRCGDAEAERLITEHDHAPFIFLIELLAAAPPPVARDAEHLAELMAHSARLVRGIVAERLDELRAQGIAHHALLDVRETFRDVLYAHPEVGGYSAADFDTLFSAAFAQTLAFGLLLVREATAQPVDGQAWRHMPEEHPLMRTALRVLSLDEVVHDIGIGFEVMRDTVNSFSAEILAIRADGRDPILYFYEDFLQTFDPKAREKYGVYYTPVEVVRYMAGALDRVLRENLGTQGLADPAVTILDPATGTGTFLLGVAERVASQVEEQAGAVEARMALRDLAGRMYAFELLVGPYAVAHYRLHHALARRPQDGRTEPIQLPRLGIYLADTLARPGAAAPAGPLGFVSDGIRDERHAADEIKARREILAIIGNPPYRRLEGGENHTLVGDWMDEVWDDLKAPVRAAGQGNQLNTFPELSVAFWRWAIWKLFEAENAPERGVVAFITNRKFLTGWPYAGLRRKMRERFDRIEVIDLRGDVRAGPRGDVATDQGVFNIMVGTAITIAVADGSKAEGRLAEVRYTDSWAEGRFNRRAKLEWLLEAAHTGAMATSVGVDRGPLEDMRPTPFQNGDWLSIREVFAFSKSGMKSGNDDLFVSVNRQLLRDKIIPLIAGRDDPRYDQGLETQLAYRPLDRRWFFNDPSLLNRPGPDMQRAWGSTNVGLYALKSNTGVGPAVWAHTFLPDYHSLKGSTGGYAFPLIDRRRGPQATNLSLVLLRHLALAYGVLVTAADLFDAILALLSATSYSRRFAEDLEDVFPHVPFPADHAVFLRAVEIGREIRFIETFERAPTPPPVGFCRLDSEPIGVVANVIDMEDGAITLCGDQGGRISGIPEAVWSFSVSGYRLLPRWIEGRAGLPAELTLVRELRDIASRIAELIHRFDEADLVLIDTLADTLTREDLGFSPEDADAGDV